MNRHWTFLIGAMLAFVLVTLMAVPARAADKSFSLAGAVPDDVFVFTATRHNPERTFLYDYWNEVFEALAQSGIGGDMLELFNTLLGGEQQAEIERLKARATQLLDGVDWDQLGGGEFAFAERFGWPMEVPGGGTVLGPPDMVLMFRGSGDGVARNYDGLTAILGAMVEEINKAVGYEALGVEQRSVKSARLTSVNLLAQVPGAPKLPIAVARQGDVIVITLGERILSEVLELLDGNGSTKSLADSPRFKAAFAELPPPEDALVFFDMQAMLKPFGSIMRLASGRLGGVQDVYRNVRMNAEANEIIGEAINAYRAQDIKRALALTKKAHEAAPDDSIVLYNLACFNALLGNEAEALSWLEKAVEGGFYAPQKITSDSDLVSLHDEPRYKAALTRAGELAAEQVAADVVVNSKKEGEAFTLSQEAWQEYKKQQERGQKDYEQCLRLIEQAYEVAPTDSRVLYYLACFHALLGHQDEALDFLEKSVEGGFYCPRHIANDPDLESIRTHERYAAALAQARERAASLGQKRGSSEARLWLNVSDRLMNAVGILDHVATVESTDGYATRMETLAVLVPDAKDRPIYPVFGKQEQLTNFDRFLPKETSSFSISGGIDVGELYTFLEDTVREAGPMGASALAKWFEIQQALGIDVRKDVLDWIGGSAISVTLEDGAGSVWLIEVRDEQVAREKVGAAVEFLSTKLGEMMATQPQLMMLSMQASPTEHPQLAEFQDLTFAVAPQKPLVWGASDGYLVFGTSADAAALCLETSRGKHPNIRENARLMSEALVPTGPFASVKLADQRRLGEELAQGVGVVSMIGGMAMMAIPNPEIRPVVTKISGMLAKLAPVVRKIDFYKSTATLTSFDGHAWRTQMVTHYFAPEERGAATATPR